MNWQDVVTSLGRLNLPPAGYVVVGGAALLARGIRETEDIDLVVTAELFKELVRAGWLRKQRPNGKAGLFMGRVEAFLDVDCGSAERSTEWLVKHADIIDGIRVIDLATLSAFKANYGRAKDALDLTLIEAYQAKSTEPCLRLKP